MLEISGLNHSFGGNQVLFDLNFSVKRGEILGFLGPNGAGKSTTMKIITGYLRPDSGQVLFDGKDVNKHPLALRRNLGYMPENVPVYPELTVYEYLAWVAKIKYSQDPAKDVGRVMDQCGLADKRRVLVQHLSRGYRQRVGLAQAILGTSRLLILDEPTVGLDPSQIRDIRELIKGLGENRTIILSTHILPEVELTCGRVLIINKGRIVAEDTPENLVSGQGGAGRFFLRLDVEEPRSGEVKDFLSGLGFVLSVSAQCVEGRGCGFFLEMNKEADHRGELTGAVFSKGWSIQEFKPWDLSLEDAFVNLVREDAEVE